MEIAMNDDEYIKFKDAGYDAAKLEHLNEDITALEEGPDNGEEHVAFVNGVGVYRDENDLCNDDYYLA